MPSSFTVCIHWMMQFTLNLSLIIVRNDQEVFDANVFTMFEIYP